MAETYAVKIIGHIRSDFTTKFGVPRQSGLAKTLPAYVVLEPDYAKSEAFRGIEEYSHLWLIWQFSQAVRENWSPTVRPPRLGGNKRMGVFATRSPYRPNAIGLSSVKLSRVICTEQGVVLEVFGADLMDGTPILDIKPYLAFTDSHPDAVGGFADGVKDYALKVEVPKELLNRLPENRREGFLEILAEDPRPSYQQDPARVYGFLFAGFEVKFRVAKQTLTVCSIEPAEEAFDDSCKNNW